MRELSVSSSQETAVSQNHIHNLLATSQAPNHRAAQPHVEEMMKEDDYKKHRKIKGKMNPTTSWLRDPFSSQCSGWENTR